MFQAIPVTPTSHEGPIAVGAVYRMLDLVLLDDPPKAIRLAASLGVLRTDGRRPIGKRPVDNGLCPVTQPTSAVHQYTSSSRRSNTYFGCHLWRPAGTLGRYRAGMPFGFSGWIRWREEDEQGASGIQTSRRADRVTYPTRGATKDLVLPPCGLLIAASADHNDLFHGLGCDLRPVPATPMFPSTFFFNGTTAPRR